MPGTALASAQIGTQADLTPVSPVMLADTSSVGVDQHHTLSLDATHPADQVALDIQPSTTGLVTASFPGAVATSQLTDNSGRLIATSSRDIDGFNVILDGGHYDLSVQSNASSSSADVGVSVTSTNQFTLLPAPQAQTAQVRAATSCTATVTSSSVNLRSGPGTGYSVLTAGSQGEQFQVGGVNPEQNWVVVGTGTGSAWVSRAVAQLDGDCAQLTVFNIPLRDAPVAPVVVVQSAPSSTAGGSTGSSYGEDSHEADHQSSSNQQQSEGDHGGEND